VGSVACSLDWPMPVTEGGWLKTVLKLRQQRQVKRGQLPGLVRWCDEYPVPEQRRSRSPRSARLKSHHTPHGEKSAELIVVCTCNNCVPGVEAAGYFFRGGRSSRNSITASPDTTCVRTTCF
jgi:hypothetical protein